MGWFGGPGSGGRSIGGHGAFSSRTEHEKKRSVSDFTLLRRLLIYIKPFQRRLLLILVTLVLSSVCSIIMPYLHRIAIDQLISGSDFGGFLWWMPLFIGVATLSFVMQYLQQYSMAFVGENIVSQLRDDMVTRLQTLSLRYFAEGETGRIMSRVTNDAEALRMFFRTGIATVVTDVATIVGALILMIYLSPPLSLITIATIPIVIIITFVMGRFSRKAYRQTRITISTVTSMTQEAVAGMKVIQSFAQEDVTMEAFNRAQDENVKANLYASKISFSYMPITSALRVLGTVLILWFGALLYQTNALSDIAQLGVLIAFLEYQVILFMPLMTISQFYDQYQAAMSALERIFDIMDTQVEVKELPSNEVLELPPFKQYILFDKVTFGYDSKIPVIKDVTFKIASNQKIAIVGPTGAGKSTLINLLCRFYDPLSGKIVIDDHELREISLHSLRSQMGIVLQDSFLFNTTVKENIRYGRPSATDEELIEAAKAVGAHNFIMRLPEGYDTVIREGSTNISIGQRQLISFARALLADPRILILDEATSSVDPYTELLIQNALQSLLRNRTAIIIAHRLSTVRSADKIIVLNNGQIVEEGTHRELLSLGGLYNLLYRSQLRDETVKTQ